MYAGEPCAGSLSKAKISQGALHPPCFTPNSGGRSESSRETQGGQLKARTAGILMQVLVGSFKMQCKRQGSNNRTEMAFPSQSHDGMGPLILEVAEPSIPWSNEGESIESFGNNIRRKGMRQGLAGAADVKRF